ncbi:unnamed protein product [Phytophthora fragariaefolia]|uniref:Unnamed protein product n=1 Tax=Phytophthora fragariaefolia TaxID=1490495 RepID=A0A9W6XF50_9STRA|nr:unnamed protein product [Phytophthora fragariaefolia]
MQDLTLSNISLLPAGTDTTYAGPVIIFLNPAGLDVSPRSNFCNKPFFQYFVTVTVPPPPDVPLDIVPVAPAPARPPSPADVTAPVLARSSSLEVRPIDGSLRDSKLRKLVTKVVVVDAESSFLAGAASPQLASKAKVTTITTRSTWT